MFREEGLKFEEIGGNIKFTYVESRGGGNGYDTLFGEIPEEIVAQGDEAVKSYASEKVAEAKTEWDRIKAVDADIRGRHGHSLKRRHAWRRSWLCSFS